MMTWALLSAIAAAAAFLASGYILGVKKRAERQGVAAKGARRKASALTKSRVRLVPLFAANSTC